MIKSSMKNILICALVVIVTLSTDYSLKNLNSQSSTAQTLEDFNRLELRMCRNDDGLDAIKQQLDESARDDEQYGVILIPNLVLPESVMEF